LSALRGCNAIVSADACSHPCREGGWRGADRCGWRPARSVRPIVIRVRDHPQPGCPMPARARRTFGPCRSRSWVGPRTRRPRAP
jgi:hypothetical protein